MTAVRRGRIRDSYTGYEWCTADLHLVTPENRVPNRGGCLACHLAKRDARNASQRSRRAEKARA